MGELEAPAVEEVVEEIEDDQEGVFRLNEPPERLARRIVELAAMVGEDGHTSIRRVWNAVASGRDRSYRAEMNRLAGKFLDSVEETD